jgi:hypothetical protein
MSHRKSSSTCVRWFRPSLEILEDRTVPSALGDLLTQFGQNAAANVATGEALVVKVNADVVTYNLFDKNFGDVFGSFGALLTDSLSLLNIAKQVSTQVELLGAGIAVAQFANQLSPADANALNLAYDSAKALSDQLTRAANQAMGDAAQAIIGLYFGMPTNLAPIQTLATQTSTTGSYTADYYDPPGSASASGPSVTESVYASQSPDSNAPLNVQILYEANDNTSDQTKVVQIAPGTSQTVSLPEMPCSAGFTGTFRVFIDGELTHTATVNFTP